MDQLTGRPRTATYGLHTRDLAVSVSGTRDFIDVIVRKGKG
jgi:hypothetical protein